MSGSPGTGDGDGAAGCVVGDNVDFSGDGSSVVVGSVDGIGVGSIGFSDGCGEPFLFSALGTVGDFVSCVFTG